MAGVLVVLSVFLGADLLSTLVGYQAALPPRPLIGAPPTVGEANAGESLAPDLAVLLRREPATPASGSAPGEPDLEEGDLTGRGAPEPGVELQGLMVGGGIGVAVLRVDGEDRTVGVGESAGGWEVMEIHPDHVVLARDGRKLPLALSGAPISPPPGQGPPVLPPPDQVPLPPAPIPAGSASSESVETLAPAQQVDLVPSAGALPGGRREVEAFLEQGAALARDVRGVAVPGQGRGVRLEFRNPVNALATLGLRDGDVVLALNGEPIRTAEELYNSWLILRNTPQVEFEVLRAGKALEVRYEFAEEG